MSKEYARFLFGQDGESNTGMTRPSEPERSLDHLAIDQSYGSVSLIEYVPQMSKSKQILALQGYAMQ